MELPATRSTDAQVPERAAWQHRWVRLPARHQLVLGLVLLVLGGTGLGAIVGALEEGLGYSTVAMAAIAGAVVACGLAVVVLSLVMHALGPKLTPADDPTAAPPQSEIAAAIASPPVASVLEMPEQANPVDRAMAEIREASTGAFSQRYFIAAADREWSRIRRLGEDAALLMIDADQLRRINESHGLECGDAMLLHLTRLVNATLRQYDLMARFNAGVLVVYLPNTDPIGAIDVAERIRERVASFSMSWPGGPVSVTVSVGVASVGADHMALDTVIGDAGVALREAKAAGRNCVRAAPVPPKRSPARRATLGDGHGGSAG